MWPEVVMENHTRSSAVHGKSHSRYILWNVKFILSIFQIIFLSIFWGAMADPMPREKDDEPVLEIQFYEVKCFRK